MRGDPGAFVPIGRESQTQGCKVMVMGGVEAVQGPRGTPSAEPSTSLILGQGQHPQRAEIVLPQNAF